MKKLLALVVAVVAGSVLAAEGARTSFRFASWNIGHFSLGNQPSSSVRPEEAEARSADYRRFLGEVGADVIGVCEYSADFCKDGTVRTEQAVFGDYGQRTVGTNALWRWNAVFSKGFPVTDGASVPFTADYPGLHKWLKGTAYTTSVLEIAGERVVFAQVHLAWEELRLRRAQMDQLIRDLADESHVVIAGDFNVGIDATEGFEAYLKDRTKVSRRAKSGEFELFRKAGYALGNDESFPTAPAGDRKYPLDNIIVRGLKIRDFRVFDRPDLSDHALVTAVLELDGPCAAAQPGVMMRFASVQTRSLAEWKETAKAFAGNPGCCDDIWFSTGESFPSVGWHRGNAARIAAAAADLRALGIGVSLQFEATIGHGDPFPTAEEKKIFEKPWTGWTGPSGVECKYCNCPRQPAFLKRLAEICELYAEIRPAVVWIDDDLRVVNHYPASGKDGPGCWCTKCIADFSAEEGRPWTREALHAAWKGDEKLRERWYGFSARSMAEVACTIARSFRKVAPKIELGIPIGEYFVNDPDVAQIRARLLADKKIPAKGYFDEREMNRNTAVFITSFKPEVLKMISHNIYHCYGAETPYSCSYYGYKRYRAFEEAFPEIKGKKWWLSEIRPRSDEDNRCQRMFREALIMGHYSLMTIMQPEVDGFNHHQIFALSGGIYESNGRSWMIQWRDAGGDLPDMRAPMNRTRLDIGAMGVVYRILAEGILQHPLFFHHGTSKEMDTEDTFYTSSRFTDEVYAQRRARKEGKKGMFGGKDIPAVKGEVEWLAATNPNRTELCLLMVNSKNAAETVTVTVPGMQFAAPSYRTVSCPERFLDCREIPGEAKPWKELAWEETQFGYDVVPMEKYEGMKPASDVLTVTIEPHTVQTVTVVMRGAPKKK